MAGEGSVRDLRSVVGDRETERKVEGHGISAYDDELRALIGEQPQELFEVFVDIHLASLCTSDV